MSNCDDYTCPLISDKCGEPDTLDIIQQFRKVYEDKLKEIDKEGCSDSLQLKLKVQEKWIENLTEQTEMMARVVKELEIEAAERVQMLEDKLKRSAESACEVMRRYQMYDFQFNSDDYFQRVGYLENDLKNLLEFIRRVREDNRWSIEGLIFYEVDYRDLFGKDRQDCKCNSDMLPIDEGIGRGEEEVSRDNQDEVIERLRKEIDYLRSTGSSEEELLEKLKKQKEQYDELKQNMIDMRQALTEEVACKHDLILLLKKDIQQLEERCIQADKQTAFKDDIIKELRKEIKQLKQQVSLENPEMANYVNRLTLLKEMLEKQYQIKKTNCRKILKLNEEIDCKNQILSNLYEVVLTLVIKLFLVDNYSSTDYEKISVETCEKQEMLCNCDEALKKFEEDHQLEVSKLQSTITDLRNQLQDNNNNNVLEKSDSDISTTTYDCSNEEPNHSKLIRNKDEIIQLQNGTLNMIQIDLQEKKKKEKLLEDEIEKRQAENDRLKEKCKQLEKNLANTKEQTENLQKAVDLYLNSINVFEASEERSKLEIEQQRMTIANLQEALVDVKHELDEIKGRNQQDFDNQQQMVNIMYMNLLDMERKRDDLRMELSKIHEAYKHLNDVNFELEVEHFNTLQDTTILETQLIKYQNQLRNEEKTVQSLNDDLRVLQQEKHVYEQIISYFKNEMSSMSGELTNLQDLLEISNQTCKEENKKLIDTVTNLENINQRLQSQLNDNQQKILHENEANLVKINELELIIKQKDVNLELHNQEINQLTSHLDTIMKENQELNERIDQLQIYYQHYENNESDRDVIIKELSGKIQMLEQRNQKKIDELLKENNQLRQILEDAKKELEEIRNNKELTRSELNTIKETLQKKQEETKLENMNLLKKYEDIKNKLHNIVNDKNRMENELLEMKRKYDGILQELKESLSKINTSIINGNLVKNLNYFNNTSCACNLIEMCKGEIRLTEKLFENFKDEYTKLLNNLNEINEQNNDLISKLQHKDNEILKNHQELQQTKRLKQQFDGNLNEFIEFLKLEMKNVRSIEDYSTTTKQEEILLLKDLIKEIIQEQISLNKEKEKLLSQINRLQTALNKHEDANRLLHSQYETNHLELKHLLENNKLLQQEKDDINNELEALQNHCSCLERRNRQLNEIIRNLELELVQTKAKRDDICAESKLVIDCVRAWLNEQKKINNEIQQRKLGSSKVQSHNNSSIPNIRNKSTNCSATPYDWNHSLGSQGPDTVGCLSPESSSLDDDDNDDDDNEDDEDNTTDIDQDDDFVRRAEEITNQIRCNNRCFKNRFPKFCVSKNDD